ncbi:MAG TPA: metallophosphoesterase family protein [Dehalococcoidia bacterium]|nr:metallophosphoesterase family protein [Dehalococcoidia bacterium]
MRVAVVSDVHANMAALEAVLRSADAAGGIEAVWTLGDIVGYGPDPNEVVRELRRLHAVAVAGNHDRAATGQMGVEEFNPAAADAALWTKGQLGPGERGWLHALPLTHEGDAFTLAHGSLRDPVWEYLLRPDQAAAQFARQRTPFSLVGHSHLPFVVEEQPEGPRFRPARDGETVALGQTRLILNPGSVGQPRDGDPRASWILYDAAAAAVTFHRVEYDIAATQERMRAAGLDRWLIERLAHGR